MDKPIRVLHVLGRLDRGGAETMVMNLYRNIDRNQIQFDFVIHTNDECDFNQEIYNLGGKVHNVPRYTGKNHIAYKRAWKELFKNYPEYKVIHGHMRSTASIYIKIAKKFGLNTIVHSHSTSSRGNKIEQLIKNILQLPIRYTADYLLACSSDAGRWLFGKNIQNKNNFFVIKNAIDIDEFKFDQKKRKQIRKKYNIDKKIVLGHVGNFTTAKNHFFLLDVFFEFQKKNEDVILILVGDGCLKKKIHTKISDLGIENKVIMIGASGNVNDYLQAMDLFLFPSIFEGLGIAAIEAQAAGLPCVISENIPNEVCITKLVKKLPIDSYKKWVDYLSRIDPQRVDYTEEIINNGYDIKSQVKNLQKFYLNIIKYV